MFLFDYEMHMAPSIIYLFMNGGLSKQLMMAADFKGSSLLCKSGKAYLNLKYKNCSFASTTSLDVHLLQVQKLAEKV
jgi:hypothetical protein